MKTFILGLVMSGVLAGCSVPQEVLRREVAKELEAQDSALCEALKDPVDDFANEVIKQQKNTPDGVIIKGTVVIRGYDEGCN